MSELKAGDLVEIINVDGILCGKMFFKNGDTTDIMESRKGIPSLYISEDVGYLTLSIDELQCVRKVAK